MEKRCLNCGISKPITEFIFKNKAKRIRNARCKECTRAQVRASYYKNRQYYLKYRAQYNRQQTKIRQEFMFNYLSKRACVDCGIKDPIVLQFDHVRGQKLGAISDMLFRKGSSMKAVLAEISKCEIRCANCHAKKTARQFNYFAAIKTLSNLD